MITFYNSIRSLLLVLVFLSIGHFSQATHVAGGYIQLECTGVPNQYILRLILYRDCSGATLGNTATVTRTNSCGLTGTANTSSFTVTRISVTEVSQICAAQLNNTTCNGGTQPGYQEHVYQATVNLAPCNTWSLSYSLCCRNTSVNVTGQPTFYTQLQANTATNNCNTTPFITAAPEPFTCINQPVTYNLGAYEPNGHTLAYTLVSARSAAATNVPYNAGYSGAVPIPGITVNPTTGTVNFTPTTLGAFIIVIRIDEYDAANNLLSQTFYDYQTFVINCNNVPPQPPAGGVSSLTGSITQTSPNAVTFCQGFQGCFNVVFTDANAANILTVTSNIASVLPGAIVTQTGNNPKTVTVCWTPSAASGNQTINFTVVDDACPITGLNNYAVLVNVTNPGTPTIVITPEACFGTNQGSATITVAGGNPPFTFSINGPSNQTNTTGVFNNLPPGNYNYVITQSIAGCAINQPFTVNPGPILPATSSFTNPLCNGACNGTATINPTGGVAPYTYTWLQGGVPIGQTTQTASNLCAGTYTGSVTDANGCIANVTVTLVNPTAVTGIATPTPVLCNGQCTGVITVSGVSGGTAPYTYSIDGGAYQPGLVFNSLCAGPHIVSIRDANGCILTLNTTVTSPPVVSGTVVTNTPATCGLNNGSLTIAGSGGTPPYTYNINGGAFQASGTFNALSSGVKTIIIQDANGCQFTLTVTVNNQPGPVATIASQTNVSCAGGVNGSVIINGAGGTGTLSYDLNPGPVQASNTFNNLSAGAYNVVVTDANGCSSTVNFTITQPTQLTFSSVPMMVTCNGQCNGQITVTANNATPPYQYSSNGGLSFQPSNVLTGLCAGSYNIVVRDANGCLANANITITQPTALTGTLTPVNPICQGICNGTITVTGAGGGTPPLQYNIDGGPFQSGVLFNGLCSGTHTVIIRDANGCTRTVTATLVDPPGYTINTLSTTPSNCGFNDGAFSVQAVGGAGSYTYNNVTAGIGPQASGTFNNLVAGAYQVVATDANGCTATTFVGVNDIQMSGTLNGVTPVTCFGVCDGTVSTIATGGNGTITYDLDNGLQSQFGSGNFANLCAGPHAVTMIDQGFCVYVVPFTIVGPNTIQFTTSKTDVTCNGGSNGSITFNTPTGGTPPYQYSIDNGVTFQAGTNFSGLTAGTYTLVVRDANGCTVTGTVSITQPTAVSFTSTQSNLTCFGNSSGTMTIIAAGGTPPYTYSNNGGATFGASFSFFALSAGSYSIVVRDNVGCTSTGTVTITQPAALGLSAVTDSANCNGACDGTILVTASGGTLPYLYSSNNGTVFQTSSLLANLCAGNYTVVIKDANGCTISSSQSILQPTAVSHSTVAVNSTCGNANGSLTINASGGTPSYQYSITGGASYQASNAFVNLTAQSYSVSVQDQYGCLSTSSISVPNAASPVINFILTANPLCNGGTDGQATVTASGGTGTLQYSVDGGPNQSSNVFNGLAAGTHTVVVTDNNGCTATSNFTLTQPSALSFISIPTHLSCFNNFSGSISVTASGGVAPYNYSYDNGATFTAASTNNFIAAGTYQLVVRDFNGCMVNGTITLNQPTALVLGFASSDANCYGVCDGTATATPSGGTVAGSYVYTWSNSVAGPNQSQATGLCAGNYTLTVNDDNGCTVNTNWTIAQPPPILINSVSTTSVLCNGDCNGTATINSANATQYSLDGGTSYQASNVFTNLCAGVYNLEILDAAGCPADSIIHVIQPDVLVLTVNTDTTICSGATDTLYANGAGGVQPFNFTWSNGGNNQFIVVNPTATTNYSVFITDFHGCVSSTESSNVFIFPNVGATISNDTTVCPGSLVTLSSQGNSGQPGYTYLWNTGATTPSIDVSPSVTTNYSVIVSDLCLDTAVVNVNVLMFGLPQVNILGDTLAGCSPHTVNFTNTTPANQVGNSCVWTIDGQTYSGCNGPQHVFTTPGCYDVNLLVTSPDGCVKDSTFQNYICVYTNPVPDFTWNPAQPTTLNYVVNFTNNTSNGVNYVWDFAGLGNSTLQDPTFNFQPDSAGNYLVCLTATSVNGCVADTCKIVFIADEYLLYVPNAFTPDGDGVNDYFIPSVQAVDPLHYDFMIFNRWGELIFQTASLNQGWDGQFRGMDTKQDVYVWKIICRDNIVGKQRTYVGHVSLLR